MIDTNPRAREVGLGREDGEGRLINFKNTVILLTTNVGSDLITNLCKDPELTPDADGIAKALRQGRSR